MKQSLKKILTIILAEDDEGHALLIKRNIKRSGIVNEIVHLRNGEEVLNYFLCKPEGKQSKKNYIILLDIKMPKIDGIEVLEKLKKNKKTRDIPIIMISTTDNPREIEKCHSLGCSSYIVKPIDYQHFIDTVSDLGYTLKINKDHNHTNYYESR